MATQKTDSSQAEGEPRTQRSNILAAARRVRERDGGAPIALEAIAAEAGVTPEILRGHFQTPQEILLSLSAEDLAIMAQAMRPHGASDDVTAAMSRPPGLLKRKGPITDNLDQVMKELVPDANASASATPQARLERRIQMLEKAFSEIGERNEKALRERGETVARLDETIAALRTEIAAIERKHAETVITLKKSLKDTHVRMNGLEFATLGAPAPAPVLVPEYPPANENLVLDGEQSQFEFIGPPTKDAADAEATPKAPKTVSYLTAARRAANDAAVLIETAEPVAQTKPKGWKRIRFLLFGFLAPMTIIATAVVVLNRNTVTAETVHKTTAATLAELSPPPELVALEAKDPSAAQITTSGPLAKLLDAATSGKAEAERAVGLKYLAGDGVPRDETEAARWLLRAAYQGEAQGEYWLGTLYARGIGVPADADQAVHWYEAAAMQGNSRAMHALGVAYLQGVAKQQDSAEAARWFTRAAETGLVESAFDLAVLYEKGAGVTRSLSDAYKWYAIAALEGQGEAESRMTVLEPRLLAADLAAAQRQAGDFKIKPTAAIPESASSGG